MPKFAGSWECEKCHGECVAAFSLATDDDHEVELRCRADGPSPCGCGAPLMYRFYGSVDRPTASRVLYYARSEWEALHGIGAGAGGAQRVSAISSNAVARTSSPSVEKAARPTSGVQRQRADEPWGAGVWD